MQVGRAGRDGGGTRGWQVHRGVLEVERHKQSLPVRADLVDQLGVGQVQRLGSGVVQPGVAPAYPDQLLVQPVDAPAVRGEVRWSSSWLASTFHAMDESAVPACYKIRVRRILSETLLGAFPACTHRHAGPRRCWLDCCLIRRRSMVCWPGSRP